MSFTIEVGLRAAFAAKGVDVSFFPGRAEEAAKFAAANRQSALTDAVVAARSAVSKSADGCSLTDTREMAEQTTLMASVFEDHVVPYDVRAVVGMGEQQHGVALPETMTCAELIRHLAERTGQFDSVGSLVLLHSNVLLPTNDEPLVTAVLTVSRRLERPLVLPIRMHFVHRDDLLFVVRRGAPVGDGGASWVGKPAAEVWAQSLLLPVKRLHSAGLAPECVPPPFAEVCKGYDTTLSNSAQYYGTDHPTIALVTTVSGTDMNALLLFKALARLSSLNFSAFMDKVLVKSVDDLPPLRVAFDAARLEIATLRGITHGTRIPVGFTVAGLAHHFEALPPGASRVQDLLTVRGGSDIYVRFSMGAPGTALEPQSFSNNRVSVGSGFLTIPSMVKLPKDVQLRTTSGYKPLSRTGEDADEAMPVGQYEVVRRTAVPPGAAKFKCRICEEWRNLDSRAHVECRQCYRLMCTRCYAELKSRQRTELRCPHCQQQCVFGESAVIAAYTRGSLKGCQLCVARGHSGFENATACRDCTRVVCAEHKEKWLLLGRHESCKGTLSTHEALDAVAFHVRSQLSQSMESLPTCQWRPARHQPECGSLADNARRTADTYYLQRTGAAVICTQSAVLDAIMRARPSAVEARTINSYDELQRLSTIWSRVVVYIPDASAVGSFKQRHASLMQKCVEVYAIVEPIVPESVVTSLVSLNVTTTRNPQDVWNGLTSTDYHHNFDAAESAVLTLTEPAEFFCPSTMALGYYEDKAGWVVRADLTFSANPTPASAGSGAQESVSVKVPHFSTMSIKSLLTQGAAHVDQTLFDPAYDYDYVDVAEEAHVRGCKPYYRPVGCRRFAVNVSRAFKEEGDAWLGMGSGKDVWPSAYHGTAEKNGMSIVKLGLQQGGTKVGTTEIPSGLDAYGKGVYVSPYPSYALEYAYPFTVPGLSGTYRMLCQVRVRPNFSDPQGRSSTNDTPTDKRILQVGCTRRGQTENEIWLASGPDDVRLYGICFFHESATNYV